MSNYPTTNYPTMFHFEKDTIDRNYTMSWKALASNPYEPPQVAYLWHGENYWCVKLIFENGSYRIIEEFVDMSQERVTLRFLEMLYQEDCDFFEGDKLAIVGRDVGKEDS